MKAKLNHFLFFIVTLFLCQNYYAQKWVEMMNDTNSNYYDVVKEFNSYWKDRPYERSKGFRVFKRWQWFTEPRVYPSGSLKLAARGYAFEKYKEFLNENPQYKQSQIAQISSTVASWIPLGPFGSPAGGDAGRIQAIRMQPGSSSTFYVGTAAGGLWVTNDGGSTYTTTTDQIASLGVSDIAIDPTNTNNIYISTGDKDAGDTHSTGVLKSTDGGATWNTTGLIWSTSQQRRIYRVLINPLNPNTLFAASSVGMYKSINAGTTWSLVSNYYFYDAEYKPGDTTVIYGAGANVTYRSTNSGNSFTQVSVSGLPSSSNRLKLAVTPANQNVVYVLASSSNNGFGGLYLSINGGSTYTQQSTTPNIFDWSTNGSGSGGQGWYDLAIGASPTNSNEIIAGGVNSWRSLDGGVNWSLNTHWYGGGGKPYVHADLHCVLFTGANTCYMGTDGGVAVTTDDCTTWNTINGSMNIAQVYRIGNSANLPGRIVSGHQDNGTNLSNGTSWTQIYGGDGAACFIDWSNNNNIVESYVNGEFNLSTNGGSSWWSIYSGITGNAAWVAPIIQHPYQANTYYAGYSDVWVSNNQGSTWTQLSSFNSTLDKIRIAPSNTNVIYANSSYGLWKTTNAGASWSSIVGGISIGTGALTDICIDNQNENNVYCTLSGYASTGKVFNSTNGGATWQDYSTGLPPIPINCITYVNNSSQALYVGTDVGVYYREASMSSWIPYFNALPNVIVNDLQIFYPTGKLRAATYGRGVWETPLYSNSSAVPNAYYTTLVSPACTNTPIQFNDMSANTPTAWVWNFSGASVLTSTLQNPIVTYSASGIYSVSLTATNGNGSSTPYIGTISVVVSPTAVGVPALVCTGQSGYVSVNTNASQVIWSNGQLGMGINVNPGVNSVYNYTASSGACIVTGSSAITYNTPPQTPTITVTGNVLSTTVVAQTYQWYLNGGPIAGATGTTYTMTQNGWYSLWVGNNGCQTSSTPLQLSMVGIDENVTMPSVLSVGPNPVSDRLNVMFSSATSCIYAVQIFDVQGKLVNNTTINPIEKTQLNVEALTKGNYVIKFKSALTNYSFKFIKE
ncbi:MAG: T9SS type A sorting domain-containing protein [Bacteroidetes bacterium]|nr:T9SS type A sorting domain-containing protein [Bacteroidota bacterium]